MLRRPGWIRQAVRNAERRAGEKDVPFDITVEDMEEQWRQQDGYCYWFRVPMGAPEGCRHHPLTPSLDRVMPEHGYTYGNVVWACLAANSAKRDTDPDYWEEFLGLVKVCLAQEEG